MSKPASTVAGILSEKSDKFLETHIKCSSAKGLSSITTLIVGAKCCVIIDPPFLISDAKAVVAFKKEITNLPVAAVFVTHHHPDHFFSANPILEAFPEASFFCAPYVRAGIDREYDEKVKFWPTIYGDEVPTNPRKPDVYPYSFFIMPGNTNSPVILLGPVQGDTVDHSMFYLPREKVIITGDCMYGRTTHVWAEEIETPAVLEAWRNILDLIDGLDVLKIIPGHLESGNSLSRDADMAHNRKYLDLFATKVTYADKQLGVAEMYETFKNSFPECTANLDFFLGKLSNQFGEGGEKWEENRHHDIGSRTAEGLDGFIIGQAPAA